MIGVTIGLGKEWVEIAHAAAQRMNQMTGLKTYVIGEPLGLQVAHPSWMKCHITGMFPEENEFLVFDADIICLRGWSPENIFSSLRESFCAVPDRNLPMVYDECVKFKLPFPDWYVNAGLLMFHRRHQPVWDAVWAQHPQRGRWLEQTALNEALLAQKIEVARLPRIFNQLPNGETLEQMDARGVVNFHFADQGGDATRILELQKELFK